jgi:hypothetical protein
MADHHESGAHADADSDEDGGDDDALDAQGFEGIPCDSVGNHGSILPGLPLWPGLRGVWNPLRGPLSLWDQKFQHLALHWVAALPLTATSATLFTMDAPLPDHNEFAARGGEVVRRHVLARQSRVSMATLADFEAQKRMPYDRTLAVVQRALEAAGVEFTKGDQPGVRLKATPVAIPVEQLNASNDD